MDYKDTLTAVCNTLNRISVTGVQNMDMLLGCYSTLQELIKKMDADDQIEVGSE